MREENLVLVTPADPVRGLVTLFIKLIIINKQVRVPELYLHPFTLDVTDEKVLLIMCFILLQCDALSRVFLGSGVEGYGQLFSICSWRREEYFTREEVLRAMDPNSCSILDELLLSTDEDL